MGESDAKRALRLVKGLALFLAGNRNALTMARWVNRFGRLGIHEIGLERPLGKDALVFDVGGYMGDYALAVYQRYRCRVWTFEPVAAYCDALQKRVVAFEKIRCFPIGLSDEDRMVDISVLGAASTRFRVGANAQPAQMKDIVKFLADERIEAVDLLKLNIEGEEYALMERLIRGGYAERMGQILIQFHADFPNAIRRRRQIRAQLAATHTCTLVYPFVWEHWLRRND